MVTYNSEEEKKKRLNLLGTTQTIDNQILQLPFQTTAQPGITQLPGTGAPTNIKGFQGADLSSLLQQSMDMINPYLQQQKNTATSASNQNMQRLTDQWASRGLAASGVAASQQQQMASDLTGTLANIDAQGQVMGLENAYNLGGYLENQRQFDLNYGLDRDRFTEEQRQFNKNFTLDEAATTGTYMPEGTGDLINQIVQAKEVWNRPDATAEEKAAANQQANQLRMQLNQMGVSTDYLGADTTLNSLLDSVSKGRIGTQTLASRESDRNFSLDEAATTGRYLPAGSQSLINQLVEQKQIGESANASAADKRAASQRANELRASLSQMGVDTNALGANTSLADMLQRLEKGGLGQQTESSRQFDQDQRWQRESFDREMDLAERGQQFEESSWEREQSFTEEQAAIDNSLRQQGVDLDRARVQLQELQFQTDKEYNDFLKDQEIDKESARRSTSSAVAQAMQQSTLEAAYEWVHKNADQFYETGVDVAAVMAALEQKFGSYGDRNTGTGTENPFQ